MKLCFESKEGLEIHYPECYNIQFSLHILFIECVLACVILFNASILMYLEDKDFHLFCMSPVQNGTSTCLQDQHCGFSVNIVILQLHTLFAFWSSGKKIVNCPLSIVSGVHWNNSFRCFT